MIPELQLSPSRTGTLRDPSNRFVQAAAAQVYPTSNLQRLLRMLSGIPKPHVLDLGRLSGANIEFMIQKGFKVYVDDRITDLKPAPPPSPTSRSEKKRPAPAPLEPLEYDPALFDAVLCWDIFDYLVAKQAQELIAGIAKALKPKGLLLAFFYCNRTTSPPPVRYRILQADQLEYKPLSQNLPRRIYENREIQELFTGFDTVNSCFLINQMREVLVQRQLG
ncbi:MAG TPA: class I SAM-dependent methyltransferase [Nitrospiria bacterium]|nr:class I SAM-dependent methyltransferase [Nitrospiria bacterium]